MDICIKYWTIFMDFIGMLVERNAKNYGKKASNEATIYMDIFEKTMQRNGHFLDIFGSNEPTILWCFMQLLIVP